MKKYLIVSLALILLLGIFSGCDSKSKPYEEAVKLMEAGSCDLAAAEFAKLGDYKDSRELYNQAKEQTSEQKRAEAYEIACTLMEAGSYDLAAAELAKLGEYKDSRKLYNQAKELSSEQEKAEAYEVACTLLEAGSYDLAAAEFAKLGEYKDSRKLYNQAKELSSEQKKAEAYVIGQNLLNAGEFDLAAIEFAKLGDYKDSKDLHDNMDKIRHFDIFKEAQVGTYVNYGTYEQDNDTSNGMEEIEWLVLAMEESKVLLISRYGLNTLPFDSAGRVSTWEECSLRYWLNSTFIKKAFTTDQQQYILTTNVSADKNPDYDTEPGNATEDKVFLLSIPEVNHYFSTDEARMCTPTAYAAAQSEYISYFYDEGIDKGWLWWLRSPGHPRMGAANVDYGGSIDAYGDNTDKLCICVRPAMWIDLDH